MFGFRFPAISAGNNGCRLRSFELATAACTLTVLSYNIIYYIILHYYIIV